MITLDDLGNILEQITYPAASGQAFANRPSPSTNEWVKPFMPQGFKLVPDVKRVTFNGNTTVVFFVDGTHAVVECSKDDKYDRKTAVAYAIVKRMLGKVGAYDKNKKFRKDRVDGNGFGAYLQKLVDNAYDQELEEQRANEKKREAKAKHLAKQKADQDAAFEKRVNARVKQILLERAALDRANQVEDDARAVENDCTCKPCGCKTSPHKSNGYDWTTYVRPNKPFSQFTDAEKHEYWRCHNAKRKANKRA